MELQFENRRLGCLMPLTAAWQTQEQTQEVRLSEGMPDIGRTLGAWGQPVLRSKQWNSDSMTISGGILAWVLYAPEDGSEIRSMETWIPCQFAWDYPRQDREGTILGDFLLSSMDARTLSARKLMLRANISCFGQAMVPAELEIPEPGEVPEGVELLQNRYPMGLVREAGEKNFLLDEDLNLGQETPEKLVRYALEPVVAEENIMGQKLVFRGSAYLHVLCRSEEGKLFARDLEVPFSQFTELEQDYGPEANCQVVCTVTNLEPELTADGMLHLKCGIAGQYTVQNEEMVTLTEDGYGLGREVELQFGDQLIPAILDQRTEEVAAEQSLPGDGMQVLDSAFYGEMPKVFREGEKSYARTEGNFTFLGRDAEGRYQCNTSHWSQQVPLPQGDPGVLFAEVTRPARQMSGTAEAQMALRQQVWENQALPAVTGLTLGDSQAPDPGRPSFVLRRAGEDSLWQMAKSCGSTVEKIRKANGLTQEPDPEKMLLIPVQ